MPAAAVIPAELEMGNIVAVKTFVVTFFLLGISFLSSPFECVMLNFFDIFSASKIE